MDLFIEFGKILKMPFCGNQSDAVGVWEIQNEGTNLYYMNYTYTQSGALQAQFFKDETFYIWGSSFGVYQHPVKCTVTVTPTGAPWNRIHFSTNGATLPTGSQRLFASKTFKTDLLSAVNDNLIQVKAAECSMLTYVATTNTITIDMLTSSFLQYGMTSRPVDGYYRIIRGNLNFVAYLTFLKETGGYTQYTFEYNYADWNAQSGAISVMHIDTKYNVQVSSNGVNVGTFYYTPDDLMSFQMNLKPILSSLFDKRLFTTDTDPQSVSFLPITDLSEVFIKTVTLNISMNTPNCVRPSTIKLFTAPFRSSTGKGTLEEYLPPIDGYRKHVTLFNKLSYTSGVGGLFMAGVIVRMRPEATGYGDVFVEHELNGSVIESDILSGVGNDKVVFILIKKNFSGLILPDVTAMYVGGTSLQHHACRINLQNIGTICNHVNLIWQGMAGVNSWFFDPEYDEDWNVNDAVVITNSDENTITNYNTTATRKLSLKARQLSKDDKLGVSTIIEAKQVWIYSPTQARLLPCKLLTKAAKIRQSDENKYDFSIDIEIQQGVVL